MVDRVDVKLGFSCNNMCRFCVQGKKRQKLPDLSTTEAKAQIGKGREAASEIVLTGGEVTLREDLPELVAFAKKECGFLVIQIQTNGRLLADPSLCDRLIEAGATEFSPALHGPNAAAHDYLTRAPGSFRQTVGGIRNIKNRGGTVLTNTVITRSTYRVVEALAHLLVKLDVDQYQLAFPHPLGSAKESFGSIVPRLSLLQDYLPRGIVPGLRAGKRVLTEAVPLCFLGPFGHVAAEKVIPTTKILDGQNVVEDYTSYRLNEGKAKGPPCQRCPRSDQCEGPWKEYPERFGWQEIDRALKEMAQGLNTPRL